MTKEKERLQHISSNIKMWVDLLDKYIKEM
jgi:hypothetical protein